MRPFKTRFRCAYTYRLKLARKTKSLTHYTRGTPSHIAFQRNAIVLRPSVGTRFQVLFHSPSRGSFHLSLTVLVHYRSSNVFSLGRWTSQIPTGLACPVVLRYPARVCPVSPTGLSPSMASLSRRFCYQTDLSLSCAGPYNPASI